MQTNLALDVNMAETPSQDPELLNGLIDYWSERSVTYSEQNVKEMNDHRLQLWRDLILEQAPSGDRLRILDVGTGPGFFAMNLALAGHEMYAIDVTEDMLAHARRNARAYGAAVDFRIYDGYTVPFEDGSFDLVVSRNVLWNMEAPAEAVREWKRVLRNGGRALWFDANWYLYLFDPEQKKRHDEAHRKLHELYPEEIHDVMGSEKAAYLEKLALELPLSGIARPEWDVQVVQRLGMRLTCLDPNLNERIYSGSDLIHYEATPEFMVCAEKV